MSPVHVHVWGKTAQQLNTDVNAFQRAYVHEVERCAAMEHVLRYLAGEVAREEQTLPRGTALCTLAPDTGPQSTTTTTTMDALETQLAQLARDVREASRNDAVLRREYTALREELAVAAADRALLDAAAAVAPDADLDVGHLTGIVATDREPLLHRVLWRALRGNLFYRSTPCQEDDDIDNDSDSNSNSGDDDCTAKTVFVVFYHGALACTKARRICDACGARVVTLPEEPAARAAATAALRERAGDMRTVLAAARAQRRQTLAHAAAHHAAWTARVHREKALYGALNLCRGAPHGRALVAEGWLAVRDEGAVLDALARASRRAGTQASVLAVVPTRETPPTRFRTTPFTAGFHALVEAYGVARYGEVNPAAVAVVTFPFLFAVMFGDAGHGLLLLAAAAALCWLQPRVAAARGRPNEVLDLLLGGRYLLVLMALFSLYTGALYNDYFAVPLALRPSHYHTPDGAPCVFGQPCTHAVAAGSNSSNSSNSSSRNSLPYAFGVDPVWRRAENELFLANSLKMKLSIVLGVLQMVVGIVFSCCNHVHFRQPLNILFDFVPQLLFMLATFGYMVFLIFFKWLAPSITPACPYIINTMINMFISFGKLPEAEQLYPHQNAVQITLVITAVVCAVAMFFPKPIIIALRNRRAAASKNRRRRRHRNLAINSDADADTPLLTDQDEARLLIVNSGYGTASMKNVVSPSLQHDILHDSDEEDEGERCQQQGEQDEDGEGFADLFINNAIHSIEFILGCISNTASYLRLWALSLAHSQLSVVFYEQLMLRALKGGFFAMIFVCFAAWGGVTLAILLGMEALSAFLHCLRLHWVEFMNKFYSGEGYAFVPFSFKQILEAARLADLDASPNSD